ncbi:DUF551 domain-containing protein [Morganella morganii subsp. morganii]|nr:DUF551 domain-containing protein [Morganella morganii subsp. morganii]
MHSRELNTNTAPTWPEFAADCRTRHRQKEMKMEWIKKSESPPVDEGKYLVFGSHGRTTAWWKPDIRKFCDAESGENEGMQDWDGEVYLVTHWMPLPEKPQPPEE